MANARSILSLADGSPLPLGVGFITFQPDGLIDNAIPILQKHRVGAVWLSFPQADADHLPIIKAIQKAQESSGWDTKLFVQVGTIKAAEEALKQGVDVLVVQGTDAGGHQWVQGTSLISLLPEVRDLLSKAQDTTTAILAAGGIVDGRGCVAALGLGRLFRTSLLQLIDIDRCRWDCYGHTGLSCFLSSTWILANQVPVCCNLGVPCAVCD